MAFGSLLKEQEIRQLAKSGGLSPQAALRLVGSISVVWKEKAEPGELETGSELRSFDLGLRLNDVELLGQADRALLLRELGSALAEYRNQCAIVYQWLCSGSFDPTKLPERVNLVLLQHATRTAGRLRASILRGARNS